MKKPQANVPVYTLPEWSTRFLEDATLSDQDRQLVTNWNESGQTQLTVDEMRRGVRIRTRSWVGVVRFSSFEIHVVPKLAGEHAGLVRMMDYASGLDSMRRIDATATLQVEGTNLFDLVSLLFAEACERLVRRGILADYREIETDMPVIRGRLLLGNELIRRSGCLTRLHCRFDQQISDILENRFVLEALSICRRYVSNLDVLRRVGRLETLFSAVCSRSGSSNDLLRLPLVYNRLNDHYREAHEFARLIIEGLAVSELFGRRGTRCFAFLLDMNALFESFVTRWISEFLEDTPYQVRVQNRDGSVLWNLKSNRTYAGVIPDLLVSKRGEPSSQLPIDAKYKLYDEKRLGMGDIYQTFLYAHAFGEVSATQVPIALILYPASDIAAGYVRLGVRKHGGRPDAEVTAIGVHIPSVLAEVDGQAGPAFGPLVLEKIEKCLSWPSMAIG